MPPTGVGLNTVIDAVLAALMSEAVIVAVNCVAETKLVVRLLPFHFTTDPDTKPVPWTVSVKPGPPGAATAGTSG